MLVPIGEHAAKLIDYGVTVTKNGDPMAAAKLKTAHGDVYWNGVIKDSREGGRNIPLEALVVLGLKSVNDIESLADGPKSGVLNMEQEVSITVSHDEYKGKVRARAEWINKIGSGGFKNPMSKDALREKLGGLKNLRTDFLTAYQLSGGAPKEDPSTIPF